jgi:hypothetical protein
VGATCTGLLFFKVLVFLMEIMVYDLSSSE